MIGFTAKRTRSGSSAGASSRDGGQSAPFPSLIAVYRSRSGPLNDSLGSSPVHRCAPRPITPIMPPGKAPGGRNTPSHVTAPQRSLNMLDDDAVVYSEDLEHEFGIKISRTHSAELRKGWEISE